MRVSRVYIKGFRSLWDVEVPLEGLSVAIGPNGTGKSSFGRALALFFQPEGEVEEEDFSQSEDGVTADEVSIGLSLSVQSSEKDLLDRYLLEDGLHVSRVFSDAGKGTYFIRRKAIKEFTSVRSAPKGHRDLFNQLVDSGAFDGLTKAANKDEAFARMDEWESANDDQCEVVDEPIALFGPSSEVDLERFLKAVLVGALEDPSRQSEVGKGSAIGALLEVLAELNPIQTKVAEVASRADGEISKLLEDSEPTLREAAESLTAAIGEFAPAVRMELSWSEGRELTPRIPSLLLKVIGLDDLPTDLGRQGHGVQRTVLLGLLTALAEVGETQDATILLIVEEPEAFQHPLSARQLAAVFERLVTGGRYQVVYSTHSPLFVDPRRVEGVRTFSRENPGERFETRVNVFDIDAMTADLESAASGSGFTPESTKARLESILDSTKMEGLFARLAVIVEGPEDRALIQAQADLTGVDLDSLGIAIVDADGKKTIPQLLAFFKAASVPTYPVFDLDRETTGADDRATETAILRLLEESEGELSGTSVAEKLAYFNTDFAKQVAEDIGEDFDSSLEEACEGLGFSKKKGRKVAAVLRECLSECEEQGLASPTLHSVVKGIVARLNI